MFACMRVGGGVGVGGGGGGQVVRVFVTWVMDSRHTTCR